MWSNAIWILTLFLGASLGLPTPDLVQYEGPQYPLWLTPRNLGSQEWARAPDLRTPATQKLNNNALRFMERDLPDAPDMDPMSPEMRGVIRGMVETLAKGYQGLINRQQQILNYIYCPGCSSPSPVQSFMDTLEQVPILNMLVRSDSEGAPIKGQKNLNTFITATNIDGVLSGAGGTFKGGNPVVEFVFKNPPDEGSSVVRRPNF